MDTQLMGAAGGGFKLNQCFGVSYCQHLVVCLSGLAIGVDAKGAGCGRVAANWQVDFCSG